MEDVMDMISVIVPVYNVKRYLCECLESLLKQTYSDLEILLVDDGSTDGSEHICDEYAQRDKRIRVFHKANGGLSDARNYGIERMRGKYVSFVDSDDYLSVCAMEILYKAAQKYHADLVFTWNAVRFTDGERAQLETQIRDKVILYSQKDALEHVLYQRTNVTGAPGKLYSADLFTVRGIRFPYGVYFEDLATNYQFVLAAQKIVFVESSIYAYRMRKDGIIHQQFSERKLTCIEVTRKLYADILRYVPELRNAAASRCCSCNRMVYSQIPYQMKNPRSLVWEEIKKYRRIVISDPHARKRERISCLISYLGQTIFYCFNRLCLCYKYKVQNR